MGGWGQIISQSPNKKVTQKKATQKEKRENSMCGDGSNRERMVIKTPRWKPRARGWLKDRADGFQDAKMGTPCAGMALCGLDFFQD